MIMDVVSPADWQMVDNHAMRFEAPDVIHLRPQGDVKLEQSLALIRFVRTLPKPEKGLFSLVDMKGAGRQDPALAHHPEAMEYTRHLRAQVFYNASFSHRVMIGIYLRVSRLLKNATPANASIFETEAEARAWIAQTRANDG
jgi:hypothetical protein